MQREEVLAFQIVSDCIGCGVCASICPTSAITGEKKNVFKIDDKLCIECGACGRICPKGAVFDDKNSRIERVSRKLWLKPVINENRCTACENCVESCPADALSMKDESLPLQQNKAELKFPEKCVSCGWCLDNCQFDAIRLEVINENN